MTRRERLRRCYSMEETDRPAVYSRTGYPVRDRPYDRLKAYFEEHTELKSHWWGGPSEGHFRRDVVMSPHTEAFDRRTEILHTPKGDLT